MRRLHLIELEDQPWCPALLRDAATAYLKVSVEVTGFAACLAPKLGEALRASASSEILDLCSGGGGPIAAVLDALAAQGLEVRARLSDRFPNLPALAAGAASSDGRIDVVGRPVDATDVPADLVGFRTLFNAFHHFRPGEARRVLQSAVDGGRPIGVFEIVSRAPLAVLAMLFSPLGVWLLMPLVRPVRWSWLLFTYVIPLVPLLVLWDGVVSCLRVYSVGELRELIAGLDAPGWTWEIGRISLGHAPADATYLVGRPPPRMGV